MNLNDINGAITDLITYYGHKPTDTVYLLGEIYGICGIDEIDGKLYVLSEDGKPAVSNREYERMKAEIERLNALINRVEEAVDIEGLYENEAIALAKDINDIIYCGGDSD